LDVLHCRARSSLLIIPSNLQQCMLNLLESLINGSGWLLTYLVVLQQSGG
jgi:hypothetical protein